ncbi:hypothetical protein T484DRAFT_1909291 [Baffinella frigidus]|nr:hypothetical protein T484DRAFT_1909291 [Cryptophyta sp. CCMP2293]
MEHNLDPPPPAGEVAGARQLRVTVVSVQHLPKSGWFSSMYPFCEVAFAGRKRFTASKKKKGGSVAFEQALAFTVEDAAVAQEQLQLSVLNARESCDCTTSALAGTLMGMVAVPAETTTRIMQTEIGWEQQVELDLEVDGKPMVGKDKQNTSVTIRITVLEAPDADEEAPGGV